MRTYAGAVIVIAHEDDSQCLRNVLSSRDCEDAPENLSQAPPLQPRDSLPGVSSIALQALLVSQTPAKHISAEGQRDKIRSLRRTCHVTGHRGGDFSLIPRPAFQPENKPFYEQNQPRSRKSFVYLQECK